MAPLVGVVVIGVFLLVGLAMFGGGLRSLWTAYRIHSGTTAATMAVASGGPVDVEGEARVHEETLEAPFTGRDCLAYDYQVEEYHPDDDGSNWTTVDSGSDGVPFLLDLDRGTVFVDPAEAVVDVGDDRDRTTVDGGTEPPERIAQFLAAEESLESENRSLDLRIAELDYGDRRRYTEHVLSPGETTYVSGVGRGHTEASTTLPRAASAVVGPPDDGGGLLARLRRRLDPLTFYVADAPKGVAAKRRLFRAAILLLFGLAFTAIPGVMLFGILQ